MSAEHQPSRLIDDNTDGNSSVNESNGAMPPVIHED